MNYSNKSNLYIISGPSSKEQLALCFKDLIDQIANIYVMDPDIKKVHYELNTVYSSSGNPQGVTFGWVSEPKIYNILIGNNPDGSERVEYVEDPTWKSTGSSDWADLTPDLTKKILSPLVEPKKIMVNDEPYYIKIYPSYVTMPGPEVDPSTICCRSSPNWVTVDMIHQVFDKYNTDKYYHDVIIDKKKVRIRYPDVRIRNIERNSDSEDKKRMIYITFSKLEEHAGDALFALQMCKKVTLKQGDKECQLAFSLWKNNPTMKQ